jgi:hypothetical protein
LVRDTFLFKVDTAPFVCTLLKRRGMEGVLVPLGMVVPREFTQYESHTHSYIRNAKTTYSYIILLSVTHLYNKIRRKMDL